MQIFPVIRPVLKVKYYDFLFPFFWTLKWSMIPWVMWCNVTRDFLELLLQWPLANNITIADLYFFFLSQSWTCRLNVPELSIVVKNTDKISIVTKAHWEIWSKPTEWLVLFFFPTGKKEKEKIHSVHFHRSFEKTLHWRKNNFQK